jgi:hypothetical protein
MEKKTCSVCGKIWIIEKFDQHYCPEIPKKTRKPRAKSEPAESKTETKTEGSPLVSFQRIVT